MEGLLGFFQIILGLSAIVLVMLQPPADEFVSGGVLSSVQTSKRGWEKVMFIITISISVLFILFSLFYIISLGPNSK